MKPILVLSARHGLLPLTWRLHKENRDVEVLVRRDRYERAWEGLLPKQIRAADKSRENFGPAIEAAKAGELIVVTDCPPWEGLFRESQDLFGTYEPENSDTSRAPILFGTWFDGETHHCPHLLVQDIGAWPGAGGPAVPAAVTLIAPDGWPTLAAEVVEQTTDELKAAGFRGLVQMAVRFHAERPPELGPWRGGWTPLHMHAFLSELEDTGGIFEGKPPRLPQRFVCALPVSIPPWPLQCNVNAEEIEIPSLTAEERGQIFWHDFQLEDGRMKTAGLDGLVGVVRGAAHQFALARARTLHIAHRMEMPQRQFRPDMGSNVDGVLSHLEMFGWPI